MIRGYRAEIEPMALGRSLRVLVGVRLVRHDRAEVQAFEKAVVQLSEIAFAHHVTGGFDYLLQVEVADLRASKTSTPTVWQAFPTSALSPAMSR